MMARKAQSPPQSNLATPTGFGVVSIMQVIRGSFTIMAIKVFLIDTAFFLLLLIASKYASTVFSQTMGFSDVTLDRELLLSQPELLAETVSAVQGIFVKLAVFFIVTTILFIFFYGLSNAIIWGALTSQPARKLLKRFILVDGLVILGLFLFSVICFLVFVSSAAGLLATGVIILWVIISPVIHFYLSHPKTQAKTTLRSIARQMHGCFTDTASLKKLGWIYLIAAIGYILILSIVQFATLLQTIGPFLVLFWASWARVLFSYGIRAFHKCSEQECTINKLAGR